jgi:hypothetical protein
LIQLPSTFCSQTTHVYSLLSAPGEKTLDAFINFWEEKAGQKEEFTGTAGNHAGVKLWRGKNN